MRPYDVLIVGSGLYGSVFAQALHRIGKRCLVIDRRSHAGGNIYCTNKEGIDVHSYGPHIFHTSDKDTWDFVNSFVPFNHYVHAPLSVSGDRVYNLPFNMNTFYQLWGLRDPAQVKEKIAEQVRQAGITRPQNLEEQAISLVGTDIYETLIKGYTEKQWGRSCRELPAFIIKRLPVRFTFDNNYFDDCYQGIPIGGYNRLSEALLRGIEVQLNRDFLQERDYFEGLADHIVYTGPIDAFYGYRFGPLAYRSLRFEEELLPIENYQGNTQINYADAAVPFTRIIEHKHFAFGRQPQTVITREYPQTWQPGMEPYYPVNDAHNNKLFTQYRDLADQESHIVFGGRLADYKYYDMHQVIASARVRVRQFIETFYAI